MVTNVVPWCISCEYLASSDDGRRGGRNPDRCATRSRGPRGARARRARNGSKATDVPAFLLFLPEATQAYVCCCSLGWGLLVARPATVVYCCPSVSAREGFEPVVVCVRVFSDTGIVVVSEYRWAKILRFWLVLGASVFAWRSPRLCLRVVVAGINHRPLGCSWTSTTMH